MLQSEIFLCLACKNESIKYDSKCLVGTGTTILHFI